MYYRPSKISKDEHSVRNRGQHLLIRALQYGDPLGWEKMGLKGCTPTEITMDRDEK